MSEKSFNGSWISQFGLYRYEDDLKKQRKGSNICFYGITGTASIIIIVIFLFITNTDFDPPKRLIILSHENKSHLNQLTTPSVLIQQIPTNAQFENNIRYTTPLSVKEFHNEENHNVEVPQTLELKSYRSMGQEPALYIRNHNIYPNHRYDVRRQVEEIYQPRPFDYIMRGTPPTGFQVTHKNSSNFPQIPKDYVGNVNSIQDILRQVSDLKVNNFQEPNGMQKIKIAGTYKHRKVDDVTGMFEPGPRKNRGQNIDQSQSHSENSHNIIKDPFYKFKPNPLSDVNLMATKQFRFAPYSILSNKFVPMPSPQSLDPANLYHQIITANKNRLKYLDENSKNDNIQSKQKPFTLMLDVYPMPDDEHASSTVTYPLPVKYQNHISSNVMRHPGISSINNLQPFYYNNNYPQHKPNRYPNLPHYQNDIYFRKFASKQLNAGFYRPVDHSENNANNPSQITVHLNLFPKKKDRSDNNQKSDHLNKDESVFSEKDNPNSISIRLQERMAKLSNNVNQTEDHKHISSEEQTNSGKVSNKVDMEVFQNTTDSNTKDNVIVIDDTPEDVDSSEEIFSREFLQYQTTATPIESSDATTLEPLSEDHRRTYSIPTILPIEPRGYSHKLDTSFFKTE